MKETEDYELYDKNFDEWLRLGRLSFGLDPDPHPGEFDEDEYRRAHSQRKGAA